MIYMDWATRLCLSFASKVKMIKPFYCYCSRAKESGRIDLVEALMTEKRRRSCSRFTLLAELSLMLHVLSIDEVVRITCQSRSWFVLFRAYETNQLRDSVKSHAIEVVNAKSHAREKPLLVAYQLT